MDNPQHEYDYAGFWIRVVAAIIDSILVTLIVVPLLSFIYGTDFTTTMMAGSGLWHTLLNYVFPAIAIIIFWIYKSATPGKLLVNIRIVDAATGKQPSTGQFIGRYLGYYVSMLPLFLGIIWVGIDKRKQGFHDKLANTVVIKKPRRTENSTS